jgi:hypothetical protein
MNPRAAAPHITSKGGPYMADEFLEQDTETPTENDLDQAYGSRYLSASDIGDRKIKSKIVKVRKEELKGNEGKSRMRFILFLESLDKPMVLNATNKNELVTALGRIPAKWIGATVGLLVDSNVMFAGKRTKGLRLRVLGTSTIGKAAAKPAEPPPEPDFNDPTPDFTSAA